MSRSVIKNKNRSINYFKFLIVYIHLTLGISSINRIHFPSAQTFNNLFIFEISLNIFIN